MVNGGSALRNARLKMRAGSVARALFSASVTCRYVHRRVAIVLFDSVGTDAVINLRLFRPPFRNTARASALFGRVVGDRLAFGGLSFIQFVARSTQFVEPLVSRRMPAHR